MKIFVVLCMLAVINSSVQQLLELSPQAKAIRDKCIEQTKIDREVAIKATLEMDFPEDETFKCFMKCNLVEMGGMSESGELLPEKLKSFQVPQGLIQAQVVQMVDACKDVKGADGCNVAYNFGKCLSQQVVKLFTD